MSKVPATVTRTPFQPPKKFALTMLNNSSGAKFPTFVISYIGTDKIPNPDTLCEINAFAVEFEKMKGPDSPLELVAFLVPRKELLDFAHSLYYSVVADTKPAMEFMEEISQLNRYSVIINTDYYTYRALVDHESNEVLESQVEYRYLT